MPPSTSAPTSRSRRTPAVARALASWVFCLLFVALSVEASAQSALAAEAPPRLGIAPDARVFTLSASLDEQQAQALHESLTLGARRYFQPTGDFALIPGASLPDTIT